MQCKHKKVALTLLLDCIDLSNQPTQCHHRATTQLRYRDPRGINLSALYQKRETSTVTWPTQ